MVGIVDRQIRKGKVKDVYEVDENRIFFHFTDRVSAFDIILPSTIPQKGEVLCKFASYWFETLDTPNHMIKVIDKDKILVKKLEIIPIECVVRGYLYGSLYERVMKKEIEFNSETILASRLPSPLFDPTTKFEVKDRPISPEEIIEKGWLNKKEFDLLKKLSIELYKEMSKKVSEVGFIMADVKLEFGKDHNGNILLADSIGPDEFRLWNQKQYEIGKTQEAFDKQIVRDWLIQVGYKQDIDKAKENQIEDPVPPELPKDIIKKVQERYIYTYEKITGRKFN